MNKLVLIAGGSTLVYGCLAVLMGVLPGIQLSRTPPAAGIQPLTPLEAEGRAVFVANGCSYCHTQQVRPLPMDKVFGRPSAPGDFVYQTPELLGSERTGPDLSNVGVRQPSDVWQYIHLYDPRAVVPQSIMPRFDWMFELVDKVPEGATAVPLPPGIAPPFGSVIPRHSAVALVAYLKSLKQPMGAVAAEAPPSGSAAASTPANEPTNAPANAPASTPASTVASTPTPAPASPAAGTPAAAVGLDDAAGQSLYITNCSACHQATGMGLPGVFPHLKGNAVVNDADPTKHIDVVLHGLEGTVIDGVKYASPMPPFAATLDDAQIAAIINHERRSWGNHGSPVTAGQVAARRAAGK